MPPETPTQNNPPPGVSSAAKPKTPPNSNPPKVTSTPLSKGTAQNARSRAPISTTINENIQFIEEDLRDAPVVDFASMLKALLALLYLREIDPHLKDKGTLEGEDAAKEFAENHYNILIDKAITFCNDQQRSAELKENLRKAYSTKSETERYPPIVAGLNSIICSFENVKIGQLEASDDSVFMVNDPIPIKSADVSASGDDGHSLAISDGMPRTTKRKPDVTKSRLRWLRSLIPQNKDFGLKDWVKALRSEHEQFLEARKKAAKEGSRLSWNDITECWEVKAGKVLDGEHLAYLDRTFDASNIVVASDKQTMRSAGEKSNIGAGKSAQHKRTAALKSQGRSNSRGQKRSCEDDSEISRKKPRPEGSNTGRSATADSESSSSSGKSSPKVQCGFYGIESLRSSWDRTHAVVMLLENEKLSLRWHDSQGCIATTPIDVIAQLPLLVAMVLLFQRFGKRMQGAAGWNLQAEVDGENLEYSLPDDARSGWELKGRRLVTATPLVLSEPSPLEPSSGHRPQRATAKSKPIKPELKPREDLFFKLSWREESRDNEAYIVETAKRRAKQYLGEHAADVLNHLPDIKHSKNDPLFSTGLIRGFLGLSKNGARVPSFMLSEKLHSLDDVEPADIVARLWEIIRCLYLLWQIGIAHGDVSYWNLMIRKNANGAYGVVNDFDLAAIMMPGQASPTKQGFERTGTKPFMAIILLEVQPPRVIQRRCAHDLESVIWCLAWYVLLGVVDWHAGTYGQVGASKRRWVAHSSEEIPERHREGTEHIWSQLTDLTFQWNFRQDSVMKKPSLYSDKVNMELIDGFLPYTRRSNNEEWDWMDFKVIVEDVREEDRMHVNVAE
ncbi:hypothetical protein MD484_g8479, partial [Candolleomyces efflorescens]